MQPTKPLSTNAKSKSRVSDEAPRDTRAKKPSPKPVYPPTPIPANRASEPAPNYSALIESKTKRTNTTISHPPQHIPAEPENIKETQIVDHVAQSGQAEAVGEAKEQEQTLKGDGSLKLADKSWGPMYTDDDGQLRFRKKALDVVGAKRKPSDSTGPSDKRSAIEDPNFKFLRVGQSDIEIC
jgi:hypothetical protein